MNLFLIILAAGRSIRLKSSIPKPYHYVNNTTLLEHSIRAFKDIKEIKKTIIVYHHKHKKYLDKLSLKKHYKFLAVEIDKNQLLKLLLKLKK